MGTEWLSVLIPAVAGIVVHCFFPRDVPWWQSPFPLLVQMAMIPLITCVGERSVTTDFERRGGWVIEARYFEEWNERHQQTCVHTDSKGNSETYDCSWVEWHPAYWEAEDSNGYVVRIDSGRFETLASRFHNRRFVDMHRSYYTKDGDQYSTRWGGDDDTFTPIVTEHRYENRVQATRSVLNFPDISPEVARKTGLYDYPCLSDNFNDPAVIGVCHGSSRADALLQRANALYGASKQVRFWMLLFHDKPRSAGFDQESYWKGGNKNEVCVAVGLSGDRPEWCHVFCWSPDGDTSNDILKLRIRDFVESQTAFDAERIATFVVDSTVELFHRKRFREFKYLTVDTPPWAIGLIWFSSVATTAFICWRLVMWRYDRFEKNVIDAICAFLEQS